ncbi:hypothetical protein [Coralliovum pocilloporae]|uniref:hypothetical protein n=1 Tax=Coralliovum pocilloporae TaxID=3066369 RepID=UPI0033078639
MIPAIVLIAEVLCFLWFAAFCTLLTSMHREARHMKPPAMDRFGRVLSGSARIAFGLGVAALFVLTGTQVIEFIQVS